MPESGYRARLFQAIHAEGLKRGLDHDGLRAMALERFNVASMTGLKDSELLAIYRGWTGKTLKYRGKLPRRSEQQDTEMVSGEDLIALDQEFALRDMGLEGRAKFIRRQLRGRDVIRTRMDFVRVMAGVRAMNRRENISPQRRRDAENAERKQVKKAEGTEGKPEATERRPA